MPRITVLGMWRGSVSFRGSEGPDDTRCGAGAALDCPAMPDLTVSARSGAPQETAADTRVVALFEGEELAETGLQDLVDLGEAKPGLKKVAVEHEEAPGGGRRRVLIAGLGKRDELDAEKARVAASAVARRAKELGAVSLSWAVLPTASSRPWWRARCSRSTASTASSPSATTTRTAAARVARDRRRRGRRGRGDEGARDRRRPERRARPAEPARQRGRPAVPRRAGAGDRRGPRAPRAGGARPRGDRLPRHGRLRRRGPGDRRRAPPDRACATAAARTARTSASWARP